MGDAPAVGDRDRGWVAGEPVVDVVYDAGDLSGVGADAAGVATA